MVELSEDSRQMPTAGQRIGAIRAVLVGRAVPFARPGTVSAIDKRPVEGKIWIGKLGLSGDEQGDPRAHGGPEKAVLMYAFENYEVWRKEIGAHRLLGGPGAFGENFSVEGITEKQAFLGDCMRIGSALVEIAQPRQPCWKLNDRFTISDMLERVLASARTGWYLRVIEEGWVSAGDQVLLVQRRYPDWSVLRMNQLLSPHPLDLPALNAALALPLTSGWRRSVESRLAKH